MSAPKLDSTSRYLNDALQYGVQTNNNERVETLLNQGADLNYECRISGSRPLQNAFRLEHIDIFKLLLNYGADAQSFFNSMVVTPDAYQLVQKHPEVLTDIFAKGVKPDWADWERFVDYLTFSLDDTNDIHIRLFKTLLNCRNIIHDSKQKKMVQKDGHYLEPSGDRDLRHQMLFNAIKVKSEKFVKMLLDNGVEVNFLRFVGIRVFSDAQTPLHIACCTGCLGIVRLLLENGAPYIRSRENMSPLDIAYKSSAAEIVRFFMAKGYSSETLDKYKLHVACLLGEEEQVAEMINEDEENIDTLDCEGRSPLIISIRVKNLSLVKLLLKAGLNANPPRVKCYLKKNTHPILHAIHTGNAEALNCLLDAVDDEIGNYHELLLEVIRHSNIETFNVLLEWADMYIAPAGMAGSSVHDVSAIAAAAKEGKFGMVKALIERGANVNANGHGAEEEEEEEEDSDMDSVDLSEHMHREDFRPLSLCKDPACISLLLQNGADYHCLAYKRKLEAMADKCEAELGAKMGGQQRALVLENAAESLNPGFGSNEHECLPYLKIIKSGSVEAMKAYFDTLGSILSKDGNIFGLACEMGHFELVRYLITQNPGWLLQLDNLLPLFTEKDPWALEFSDDEDDAFELNPACSIKMVGILFDLGCSINFIRDEEDETVEDSVTELLSDCYASQRFVFSKILQELCGKDLPMDLEQILRLMMSDCDYDMVLLFLNCGYKIDAYSVAKLRRKNTDTDSQAFLDTVGELSGQPLGLQSLCRIKIRSALFEGMSNYCYINKVIEKLALAKQVREFLSFSAQNELSYIKYSGNK